MKVTIEFDEKELIKAFADAAIEMDKETLKRLIRGLITEYVMWITEQSKNIINDINP
jgi:hypothetical protein